LQYVTYIPPEDLGERTYKVGLGDKDGDSAFSSKVVRAPDQRPGARK